MSILLFIALLFQPARSWAFPEMIRAGYNNCSACHFSPTGGGVLTPYGRSLSLEVLSNSGIEGEEQFLYGVANSLPKWITFGGDVRAVQTYRDNKNIRQGRFILMQADLETVIAAKKFALVGTTGLGPIEKSIEPKGGFVSHRHYVMYRPRDEVRLRGGKFTRAYGINTADHVISIKKGLAWDQGSETYNAEASWIGEKLNVYATRIFGRPDEKLLDREKGWALSASRFVAGKHKIGASYFYGSNGTASRHIAGPNGIFGFSRKLTLLSEWDLQWRKPVTARIPSTKGVVGYQRLDYEFVDGVHGFLTQEYSQLDWTSNATFSEAYGLGLQLFPRPHFEIFLIWTKARSFAISDTVFGDLGYVMFHFYP